MKSEKGFSLIGVIIAIALVGIIAIAFLGGLANASKTLFIADERATANNLAESQIEYVKNQDYIAALEGGEATYNNIDEPLGYAVMSINRNSETVEEIIGVPWDTQNNQPLTTDDGIQKVVVVIKHLGKEVIGLESYKVNR